MAASTVVFLENGSIHCCVFGKWQHPQLCFWKMAASTVVFLENGSIHSCVFGKWQHPLLCFGDFQTLIFNSRTRNLMQNFCVSVFFSILISRTHSFSFQSSTKSWRRTSSATHPGTSRSCWWVWCKPIAATARRWTETRRTRTPRRCMRQARASGARTSLGSTPSWCRAATHSSERRLRSTRRSRRRTLKRFWRVSCLETC